MISFTNISGAEEIGANCYLLEMDGTRIVLDSGMHPKKEGKAAMPDFDSLEPNSVEAVFLSHSHLDHLGTLACASGETASGGGVHDARRGSPV